MKKAKKSLIVISSLLMLGATIIALVGEGQFFEANHVAQQVDTVGQALTMLK